MFRSIQSHIVNRVESLKKKTNQQSELDKIIRIFLIQEFGVIGETLNFSASQENKKIRIRVENKTAANELVLRSGKLKRALQSKNIFTETIYVG